MASDTVDELDRRPAGGTASLDEIQSDFNVGTLDDIAPAEAAPPTPPGQADADLQPGQTGYRWPTTQPEVDAKIAAVPRPGPPAGLQEPPAAPFYTNARTGQRVPLSAPESAPAPSAPSVAPTSEAFPAGTISAQPKPGVLERIKGMVVGSSRSGETPVGRALGYRFFGPAQPEQPPTSLPLFRPEAAYEEPGAVHGALQFAGGLTTPENLSIMATTQGLGLFGGPAANAVQRLISLGFSYQMLKGAVDQYPQFKQAIQNGDWAQARELATKMGLSGAMAVAGVKHAAGDVYGREMGTLQPGPEAERLVRAPGIQAPAVVTDAVAAMQRITPPAQAEPSVVNEGAQAMVRAQQSEATAAQAERGPVIPLAPERRVSPEEVRIGQQALFADLRNRLAAAKTPEEKATLQRLIDQHSAIARGEAPAPVSPVESQPRGGSITADELATAANFVTGTTPESRPDVTLQVHQAIADHLLENGTVVGPDGKLIVVRTPEQANSIAAKLLNGELEKQQSEQIQPVAETPSQPAMTPPGPGAQNFKSAISNESGLSNLGQLADAASRITPQKASPVERMQEAADSVSGARDAVTNAWQRLKATTAAAWDWYRRPAPWTDFKDLTGKFQGALQYGDWELSRFADSITKAIPDKARREAITNWIEADGDPNVLRERAAQAKPQFRRGYQMAQQLTPEEQTLANNIRNFHDAELDEAIKAGILEHGLENYVEHVWKRDSQWSKKLRALINYSALQPNPSFAKRRLLATYFEGEQAGFTPADKDIAFLTAVHHKSFAKAVAARAYIKSLLDGEASDGRPLAAVSGGGQQLGTGPLREYPRIGVRITDEDPSAYIVRPSTRPEDTGDYVRVNHPALRKWKWATKDAEGNPVFVEGDMLLHPEIAKAVANNLSTSAIRRNPVGRAVLAGTRELKQTLLSLSAFHQTTEAQHALFHKVNPFSNVPELDLNTPEQRALVDHGLMVADFDGMAAFSEGLSTGGGLVAKLPLVGKAMHSYTDYLFRDYIPRLKMKMAIAALDRNRERYGDKLTDDQILEMTANQANAAFGELNYKMLGRSPTMQDALRLTLLAPDFLEARGRFVGQALKPYGREQMAALVRGAVWMYVGARIANQILDDDPHWDRPFSVVYHGHEYSLRTIQGDVWNLITDPRNFVFNRLNPTTTRTLIEAVTARDRLGRQRSAGQQASDFLHAHVPISLQSLARTADGSRAVNAILKAIGVNEAAYRSKAMKLAIELGYTSGKSMSDSEQKRYEARRSALEGARTGDWAPLREGREKGLIDVDEAREIRRRAGRSELVNRVWPLSYADTLKVFKSATPEEKKELEPLISKKRRNLLLRRERKRVEEAESTVR